MNFAIYIFILFSGILLKNHEDIAFNLNHIPSDFEIFSFGEERRCIVYIISLM